MIWNPYAIDYAKGVDIVDEVTGKIYTEEQAKAAHPNIRHRLTLRGRVIGCYVYTIEELEAIK